MRRVAPCGAMPNRSRALYTRKRTIVRSVPVPLARKFPFDASVHPEFGRERRRHVREGPCETLPPVSSCLAASSRKPDLNRRLSFALGSNPSAPAASAAASRALGRPRHRPPASPASPLPAPATSRSRSPTTTRRPSTAAWRRANLQRQWLPGAFPSMGQCRRFGRGSQGPLFGEVAIGSV